MPIMDPENHAFLDDDFVPVLGIGIDTVGYGHKPYEYQRDVQKRLPDLVTSTLEDIGFQFERLPDGLPDRLPYAMAGDGLCVFLPPAIDLTRALPGLLSATAKRLAEDNRRFRDQIRIRMALCFGMVKRGPNGRGFGGGLITDLNRLVDSPPIRQAMLDHPESELAVLVSSGLYELVDRAGCQPVGFPLSRVDVVMETKKYTASAWLWVGPPGQANAA